MKVRLYRRIPAQATAALRRGDTDVSHARLDFPGALPDDPLRTFNEENRWILMAGGRMDGENDRSRREHSMRIQPLAFANALALTSIVLVVFLFVLRLAMPSLFLFIFNAQFFGADVASLLPTQLHLLKVILELLAFVGGAWGFGIVGAILYNRFIEHGSC